MKKKTISNEFWELLAAVSDNPGYFIKCAAVIMESNITVLSKNIGVSQPSMVSYAMNKCIIPPGVILKISDAIGFDKRILANLVFDYWADKASNKNEK